MDWRAPDESQIECIDTVGYRQLHLVYADHEVSKILPGSFFFRYDISEVQLTVSLHALWLIRATWELTVVLLLITSLKPNLVWVIENVIV
jgi:hypothetical protein